MGVSNAVTQSEYREASTHAHTRTHSIPILSCIRQACTSQCWNALCPIARWPHLLNTSLPAYKMAEPHSQALSIRAHLAVGLSLPLFPSRAEGEGSKRRADTCLYTLCLMGRRLSVPRRPSPVGRRCPRLAAAPHPTYAQLTILVLAIPLPLLPPPPPLLPPLLLLLCCVSLATMLAH